MKLWDFYCPKCGKVIEYLQSKEDDVPVHCGMKMQKIISRVNFARFESGDREVPILGPNGEELDLKKQDIFGRRFDDLPEEYDKTRYYWQKIEQYEHEYGRPAPPEYKDKLIGDLFGKDLIDKAQDVKEGEKNGTAG